MIVDSSAIVAILKLEPERQAMLWALGRSGTRAMSAASLLETWIVIDRHSDAVTRAVADDLLVEFRIDIEPVTMNQIVIARRAYALYGRGSGHPARLNFGDCFAYALARERNEPLLFKGNDFGHTDIETAV